MSTEEVQILFPLVAVTEEETQSTPSRNDAKESVVPNVDVAREEEEVEVVKTNPMIKHPAANSHTQNMTVTTNLLTSPASEAAKEIPEEPFQYVNKQSKATPLVRHVTSTEGRNASSNR